MTGSLPEHVRQKISAVSFVCAVLVVALHVTEPTGCGAAFYHDWIVHGLTRISVPFFLMVSGFLLMNHADEARWYGRAVRQRLQTLVVPFYCINLVGFVFLSVLPMAFGDGGSLFSVVSWKTFLQGVSPIPIGFQPPIHPLWYIRALMYLTVVSPICLAFARRSSVSGMVLLVAAFGLWMLQRVLDMWLNLGAYCRYEYDLRCFFFFALGIVLRIRGDLAIGRIGSSLSLTAGLAIVAVRQYALSGIPQLAFVTNAAGIILLIFGLWGVVPAARWPRFLVENTFAVYAFHVLFIALWERGCAHFGLLPLARTLAGTGCCIVFCVMLSCGLGSAVRNRLGRLGAVILGGR